MCHYGVNSRTCSGCGLARKSGGSVPGGGACIKVHQHSGQELSQGILT